VYFPVHRQPCRLTLTEHPQSCRQEKEESKNLSEATPKIKGAKKFRRPAKAVGPTKKEFITKVLGLKSHTFNIGNAKYAAKCKKMVNAIANHIQREYKDGADITKAIKELSLLTLRVPGYPTAKAGATVVDPEEIFLWQQDIAAVKKQIVQLEDNKKRAYVLVIGQCSPDLDSKLKGSRLCIPFFFWFLTGLIFWNPQITADYFRFRGTHVGIKSFQGKINLFRNPPESGIRPEFGGKDP
jgi:hypothetical protein